MSETLLILRRIQPDVTIKVYLPLSKVPLNLSDFGETLVLSTVSKNLNREFHGNPSSGSRDSPWRRQTDRPTGRHTEGQ